MPQKRAVKFPGLSKWVRTFHATPARLDKILPLPLNSFNVFSRNTESKDTSKFYTDFIRQCIQSKSISGLRTIQTHMIKSGFSHLSLGNKLIDAFLKCGSIEQARNLFDELPQRHIVTWNSMISSYISQRRCEEAVKLYNRMVLERAFPDEFTFSSIFKAFSHLDLVYEGRRAHGQAVVFGLEVSNAFVGSSLVDMYAKFGKLRDARMILDRVLEKDVVLVTALIVGFAQHGKNVEALEVFKEMIDEGIEANGFTFASILSSCANLEDLLMGMLIHGLIIRSGFEFAVAAQTSLLTMYSKCGLVDDSLKVFKQIIEPNQVTWTSLITGLAQNGREEIALSKFRRMIRSSISPNAFTFSSVLRACSSLAMLEQGKQIHAMVAKYGLSRDTFTGAALIDLYGKCGITEMARLAFDCLSKLDVVSLNTMIYSYAQNGYGNEALKLFSWMKDLGLEPNDVTFLSILCACNNAGLVEEGCNIFAAMKNNPDVELTKDHYSCMVDLLGRAGRLKEAETLILQVKSPDVVLWRTLLSACRNHGEVEMAKQVMNRVLELDPGDEGTHVLVSNLFASTGNWRQVIKMKSSMREMKLKKNPAMSWVDVDKEVHPFMAGDRSHPRSQEIYEKLEDLIERVRESGNVLDTRFVLQNLDKYEKEK